MRRVVGRKTSGEEREGRIKKGRLADVRRGGTIANELKGRV